MICINSYFINFNYRKPKRIELVYLDNHTIKNEKFNLYAINIFFIEVCYNSLENKISGIKGFKSGNLLNRYSNIDGLLD